MEQYESANVIIIMEKFLTKDGENGVENESIHTVKREARRSAANALAKSDANVTPSCIVAKNFEGNLVSLRSRAARLSPPAERRSSLF
jgi:hypothetical protein